MRRPNYTPMYDPEKYEKLYAGMKPEFQVQIDAQAARFMRNSEVFAAHHKRKNFVTLASAKAVATVVFMAENGVFND